MLLVWFGCYLCLRLIAFVLGLRLFDLIGLLDDWFVYVLFYGFALLVVWLLFC